MFNNIIFDWSGTLVDDLGPVLEATNAVLGRYGVAALDREGFRRTFRLSSRAKATPGAWELPMARSARRRFRSMPRGASAPSRDL